MIMPSSIILMILCISLFLVLVGVGLVMTGKPVFRKMGFVLQVAGLLLGAGYTGYQHYHASQIPFSQKYTQAYPFYQKIKARKLVDLVAREYTSKKVLVILPMAGSPDSMDIKLFKDEFLDGMKGKGVVLQGPVCYEISPKRQKEIEATGFRYSRAFADACLLVSNRERQWFFAADMLGFISSKAPDCDVVVSFIGIPWQPSDHEAIKASGRKFIVAIGDVADYQPLVQAGVVVAGIGEKPHSQDVVTMSKDPEKAFNERWVLIRPQK